MAEPYISKYFTTTELDEAVKTCMDMAPKVPEVLAAIEDITEKHDDVVKAETDITNTVGIVGINEFDTEERYYNGNLVMHDSKLYRCKYINPQGYKGTWNADYFVETTLVKEAEERIVGFGYETCIVHLQNEQGEPLSGVEVNMLVSGEGTSRTGTTNAHGQYKFPAVAIGKDYEVYSAVVEGYADPSSQEKTAALAERHVYITYNMAESSYEHLVLRFKYADSSLPKAEKVKFFIDGSVEEVDIINDECSKSILKGKEYTVIYPNVSSEYQTPSQTKWVANRAERIHNVYYYTKQTGYTFLRKDGQEVPVSAVRPEMRDDIVGLIIDLVDVVGEEQRIIIDKDFPTLYKTMAGVNNDAALASGLTVYTTNPPTIATSEFNGYENSIKLKENIRSISSSQLFNAIDLMSIEINGAEYGYYVPSCGELSILFNNKNIIYDLFFYCLGLVYPLKSPISNQRYGSSSMSLVGNIYCPANYVNGSLSQINGQYGSMTVSMYWFVLIKYNKQ